MAIRNDLLEDIHQAILSGGSTPYYVEATRFVDLTTQAGADLDASTAVLLGAGGSDPEGLITMDASGVVTVNKTGYDTFLKASFSENNCIHTTIYSTVLIDFKIERKKCVFYSYSVFGEYICLVAISI